MYARERRLPQQEGIHFGRCAQRNHHIKTPVGARFEMRNQIADIVLVVTVEHGAVVETMIDRVPEGRPVGTTGALVVVCGR